MSAWLMYREPPSISEKPITTLMSDALAAAAIRVNQATEMLFACSDDLMCRCVFNESISDE